MLTFSTVLLIMLLAVCLYTDITEGKIYNKFTITAIIIAFGFSLAAGGFESFKAAFLGAAVGLLIMLPPYLLGGMGAGDVKLMAAVGAAKGLFFVVQAALAAFIVGGVIAAFLITYKRAWGETLASLKVGFLCRFKPSLYDINENSVLKRKNITFPYGVPIAFGALIILIAG